MSRNFEVQVEVFPCATQELQSIAAHLREWGLSVEDQTDWLSDERGDGRAFWGSVQLSGNETEEGAHQRLVHRLPGRWIRSRWRCIDDLPWDEDFESEPMNPATSLSA